MSHQYRIDLLRLSAAALVFLFHLSQFGLATPDYRAVGADRAFGWLEPVGWFGWVGVEIFFVISGYVIAASASGATLRMFAAKRAIRVLPTLWVCSLIALLVRLGWGEPVGDTLMAFGRSVVLWPKGPHIDGVVWTLIVEAFFYALIAGLIVLGQTGILRRPALDIGALLLGGASAAFLLAVVAAGGLHLVVAGQPLVDLLRNFLFKILLLWHGVFFALGMLLWSIRKDGGSPVKSWACIVFAAAGALEIYGGTGGGASGLVPVIIWSGAIAIVARSGRPRTSRPDSPYASWMRQAGLLTYPLYLNHFTLGTFLVPFLASYIGSRSLLLAVTVATIWCSAWLIVKGPERLLQQFGRRLLIDRRSLTTVRQPAT